MVNDTSDKNLDAFIESLGKAIAKEENVTSLVKVERVKDVVDTYKAMRKMMKGAKAKVSYKLYKPFRSTGSVSIIGKNIPVKDIKAFVQCAKTASNINVYPKLDGTIRIDFTFHGLTIS